MQKRGEAEAQRVLFHQILAPMLSMGALFQRSVLIWDQMADDFDEPLEEFEF